MDEYRYLDYHTKYECRGDVYHGMSADACFSTIFKTARSVLSEHYWIVMYMGYEFCAKNHSSNACLVDKATIWRHLRIVQRMFPLTFKVSTYKKYRQYDRLLVELELNNQPLTVHKFVLTWVRYLYEFPYNVHLRDAYWLRQDPKFRFESVMNLFNLVSFCSPVRSRDIHQVHKTLYLCQKLTNSQLVDKIRTVEKLNNVYKFVKHAGDAELLPKEQVYNADYWDKEFYKRKQVYVKMYDKYMNRKYTDKEIAEIYIHAELPVQYIYRDAIEDVPSDLAMKLLKTNIQFYVDDGRVTFKGKVELAKVKV